MSTELSAELLLGREVRDSRGEVLGRVMDICAGDEDGELVVRFYRVAPARGRYRLSFDTILLEVLRLLRLPLARQSYIVPWSEMDLSDPVRPRVRLPRSELATHR
jgi:sporulation protein YlmC with PRC-barrel domain